MKFKKIKSPVKKTICLEIKDFSKGLNTVVNENLLEPNYGVSCYNFSYQNGALESGLGLKEIEIDYSKNIFEKNVLGLPADVEFKKVWQFKHWDNNNQIRRDKLMVWGSDSNIYYVTLFSSNPYLNQTLMQFTEEPENLNYKLNNIDYNICISTTDAMQIWDGANNPYVYTDSPDIRSFCALNEKFYATFGGDRDVIRYTSNEDLTTWYVALAGDDKELSLKDNLGRINKVVSHLNYVYVFRDYGITKLWRSASSVNTSNLFCTGSVIYDKTITICGNDIYFLARDGIYKFDGSNVKKLDLKINKFLDGVDNKNSVACFHNGSFYLALKLNFNDKKNIGAESGEYKNNALIKYNIETSTLEILRGVDICSLCSVNFDRVEKVVACFNSVHNTSVAEICNTGKVFNDLFESSWTSPLSDLGYSENLKRVREVSLDTKHPCTLRIFSENEEQIIKINPSENILNYRVNVKGKKIGFEIISYEQSANISNFKFKIDLIEGCVL